MTRREGGGEEGGWKMSRRQRGEVWRIWCRGSSRCFMVVNDHHHSFDGCWRCWWFQSITFLDRILFLVILLLPTVTIPPLVLLHWREKPRNIVYGYWRKGLLIHIFKLGFPSLSVDGCSPFHHYYDDYYGGLHFTIIMVVGVVLPAHSATTETCSQVELQARTAPCRPLLCIFQKCNLDIWTTGCISLYCLTDAEVGPLRLCFCSVSGTLEFSRLLLSSGPLDSWILDAAQYQQLYKMIISLIFMEQFFSCHSLSLE